jgi:hypothetical protein
MPFHGLPQLFVSSLVTVSGVLFSVTLTDLKSRIRQVVSGRTTKNLKEQ